MKWLLLFLSVNLFSGVLDHLKTIENKTGQHQMRNIDFIYLINLDRRPEKLENALQQIGLYGIDPFRFSAVNGWELPYEVLDDVGVKLTPSMAKNFVGTRFRKKNESEMIETCSDPSCPCNRTYIQEQVLLQDIGTTYFSQFSSPGTIGCILSHLSVLKDAYDSGYEKIWILEDDINIVRDPRILSDLVEQLDALVGPRGWDVLFTDRDIQIRPEVYLPCSGYYKRPNFTPTHPEKISQQKQISPELRWVGSRYGSHSMIVRRSGMEKILNFYQQNQIFLPYDNDYLFPLGIKFFTVVDDVVSTHSRDKVMDSDISRPRYKSDCSHN